MAFNLGLLKEHPYATGGIVIVGGLIVFFLLSSRGGSSAPASSGGTDAAALAADEQLAQVQAGAAVQTNAQQVSLAQSQLEADVANHQTDASLEANNTSTAAQLAATLAGIAGTVSENETSTNATTTQEANQLVETENTTSMQDAVLEAQINSGVIENANNNATALATTENNNGTAETVALSTIAAQTQLGTLGITDATTLAAQKETDFEHNVSYIAPLAGQKKNSITDADNQTSIFQTILSGGNPNVAGAGDAVSATTSRGAAAAAAGSTTVVGSTVSGILAGLLG